MPQRVAQTTDRTPPRAGVQDDHVARATAAHAIAETLADLTFGRRLEMVCGSARRELWELAEDTIARAIEEHVPAEPSSEPDPFDAHRDREESRLDV